MFRLWCSVLVGVSGLDAFRVVSAAMYQLRFFMSICASHLAGCTYQLFDSLGMLISLRRSLLLFALSVVPWSLSTALRVAQFRSDCSPSSTCRTRDSKFVRDQSGSLHFELQQ